MCLISGKSGQKGEPGADESNVDEKRKGKRGREHPQINGKIERFFGEVERRIGKFGSIDKIVHRQNVIKPHMSLDYDEPANVFWYRLPSERVLSMISKNTHFLGFDIIITVVSVCVISSLMPVIRNPLSYAQKWLYG